MGVADLTYVAIFYLSHSNCPIPLSLAIMPDLKKHTNILNSVLVRNTRIFGTVLAVLQITVSLDTWKKQITSKRIGFEMLSSIMHVARLV